MDNGQLTMDNYSLIGDRVSLFQDWDNAIAVSFESAIRFSF